MSDQPKPTGEWTARTVEDLWDFSKVAEAHNAAIAAERENYTGLHDSYMEHKLEAQQLRDELKEAERNFAEADISTLQNALKEVQQLRQQLAAALSEHNES